jgi:hypothetical protein
METAMQEPMEKPMEPTTDKPKKMSFMATLGAVFWSFVGLRRRSDYENDVTGLNPVYVILAGLIGVAIFIGLLLMVVSMVVK